MMRQCESDYVVKYYGSYFKHNDLWIVMEYCAARSVSDIMRLIKRPFEEDKIQTILFYTLKGTVKICNLFSISNFYSSAKTHTIRRVLLTH